MSAQILTFAAILFFVVGIFMLSHPPAGIAYAGSDEPVVVELFTSQSCSSCPPADRLLRELATHDNVIALSCNVTYWNHLHWKDTLSRPFCTDRQRTYHATLGKGVFTPQMVVNGTYSAVGSRASDVDKALRRAQSAPIQSIALERGEGSLVRITLPSGLEDANLFLVSYSPGHTQSIPSGENRGRTVFYTNPVESIAPLDWDKQGRVLEVPFSDPAAQIAVLAQKGVTGPIVAAGKL